MSATRLQERANLATYCSMECRRTGETRTCETCGSTFYVRRSDVKSRPSHWCSRECADIGRKRGETKSCVACGKDFYVYPSEQTKPGRKNDFCSRACYSGANRSARMKGSHLGIRLSPEMRERLKGRNHYRTNHEHTCIECGWQFQLSGHAHRKGIRFCSTDCWYTYVRLHPEASGTFKGGRFPYYGPNWPHQAKLARERDNHTCQRCGLHQFNPRLDVHHVRPRREFAGDYEAANQLDNLTTLCKGCHISLERSHT